LATAACDADIQSLKFLDAPKDYALKTAVEDLTSLGAVDAEYRITERGRRLFGLPLDAPLGNLLVEAEKRDCLEDAMDLVSVLAVGRPLFRSGYKPLDEKDDLRRDGCDGTALISAIRWGRPADKQLSSYVLQAARSIRGRLRRAWGLSSSGDPAKTINQRELALAAMGADPRCAYVVRRRKGGVFWGNGGTELTLARESAVNEEKTDAVAVLGSMAVGQGYRDQRIYATCAIPLTFSMLSGAGFGEDRVEHAGRAGETVVARIERVYAGTVIEKREEVPQGSLARQAIGDLFLGGRLFRGTLEKSRDRLETAALALKLCRSTQIGVKLDCGEWEGGGSVPPLEYWVEHRLQTLGVTGGDDLGLLSPEDLLVPDLPESTLAWMDREFPRELRLGDAVYRITYELKTMEATLTRVAGKRKDPPSLFTVPKLSGFRIKVKHHSRVWVLR
jgi:ATP-dependent helicase HrpB